MRFNSKNSRFDLKKRRFKLQHYYPLTEFSVLTNGHLMPTMDDDDDDDNDDADAKLY